MRIALHPGTATETVLEILNMIGAEPIVIRSLARAKRTEFDRLILLGGTDIAPAFYGEDDRDCYPADRSRDAIEWRLTRHALANRIPIFGICRGMQILAAACGAGLYQDIFLDDATTNHPREHRLIDVDNRLGHKIPRHNDRFVVNSLHHQAIKTVPFGFDILARAPDGIVETIYRPRYLGVQFHPELMIYDNQEWMDLFVWLIDGLE